jgi:hypothetical protein
MAYEFEALVEHLACTAEHVHKSEPVRCKFCHKEYDLAYVRSIGRYGSLLNPHVTFETPCCRQMASAGGRVEDVVRLNKTNSIHC